MRYNWLYQYKQKWKIKKIQDPPHLIILSNPSVLAVLRSCSGILFDWNIFFISYCLCKWQNCPPFSAINFKQSWEHTVYHTISIIVLPTPPHPQYSIDIMIMYRCIDIRPKPNTVTSSNTVASLHNEDRKVFSSVRKPWFIIDEVRLLSVMIKQTPDFWSVTALPFCCLTLVTVPICVQTQHETESTSFI